MSVAMNFGLSTNEAMRMVGEVAASVSTWRVAAAAQKLTGSEVAFMADAFEHTDLKQAIALGAKAPRILTHSTPKKSAKGSPTPKRLAAKPAKQPTGKQPVAKKTPARKAAPARKH